MTPGNSNGKRRSSVSNASGVFEKLKTNVFKAFDDVDMDTFFEVSESRGCLIIIWTGLNIKIGIAQKVCEL